MSLKIVTWNNEHADRLISPQHGGALLERRKRILETLREIEADILCIREGPAGEKGIEGFSSLVLEREWIMVLLPFDDATLKVRNAAYATRGKH